MEMGIGLPVSVRGVSGDLLTTWAKEADRTGFSSLAVLDRLVYGSFEALTCLAAAAAVTTRIRLTATALVAPYRGNAALLAKQLATIDRISAGRLVVGLVAGGREDDFLAAGTPFGGRGARLDLMARKMLRVWGGDGEKAETRIGPRPWRGAPPLLFGGHTDIALRRAARFGQGWICGGGSAHGFAELAERLRMIWAGEERSEPPRLTALCYFALGADAEATAAGYIGDYYGFLGGPASRRITSAVLTDPGRIADTAATYRAAGCDELIFMPCGSGIGQLEALAAVLSEIAVTANTKAWSAQWT